MLKNYIKIAFRNLFRNRSNSIINVLGLSIGISCCLLILLWVFDEVSYDNWNTKADRTYRVAAEINFAGSHQTYAVAPAPLSSVLMSDFPEVEKSVRFRNYGSSLVKREFENYKERRIIYSDSTLFDVFDLKLISGSKNALSQPNAVVISESMQSKYFDNEIALGKTLTFDDNQTYKITGVIEDMPENSHFIFDFFVSLIGIQEAENGIWVSHNFQTYFILNEGVDPDAFRDKMFPHLVEKYIGPQLETIAGLNYEQLLESGAFINYYFQPLRDIHLHSDLVVELAPNGSIQYVWIFLSAALFILLIACVNFMNLTTAQSAMRAKEIGVRKVMGSLKSNLIGQFLSESILLTLVAFAIGLLLAQLVLPGYNELANKNLIIPYTQPSFWLIAIGSTLAIGLIAGSYPAFYLSSFKPIHTLAGKLSGKSNTVLRNGLVVFQFLIAVVLIVATIGIQKQMSYVQNKKLGFDREQVLILNDAYALGNNTKAYKKQISEHPGIISATYSGFLPVPSNRNDSPLCKSTEMREDNCVAMQIWDVDEDYIETMGMSLLEGRNFNVDMPTDSMAIIINETAARLFGLDNPVGKTIYGNHGFADPNAPSVMSPAKIIGVIEDFHFESLRDNIRALSLILSPSYGSLSIKLAKGNPEDAIAFLEKKWNETAPGQPFSYSFMDDSFDRMYQTELRVGTIFRLFSGLGIFIACLGLFGLAAFATERRTREIGIRKVLGASTLSIVSLLSKDFLRLVLFAMIIAVPLAWYLISEWLANFAYRVNIDAWVFVIAGLTAISVAFATVSFHSFRSASANPVNSLRSE